MLSTLVQLHTESQPSFRRVAPGSTARTSSDGSCGCLQISAVAVLSSDRHRHALEVYSRQHTHTHHTNQHPYLYYILNIYISIESAKHKTWPSSAHSSIYIVSGCELTDHSRPTSMVFVPVPVTAPWDPPGDGGAKRVHLQPAFDQRVWGVTRHMYTHHNVYLT